MLKSRIGLKPLSSVAPCSIPSRIVECWKMKYKNAKPAVHGVKASRTAELFNQHQQDICKRTDHMFAVLMMLQWVGGIIAAALISPRAWVGTTSQIHVHI